jgi:propionyl-CoA carboxylase alpha chain
VIEEAPSPAMDPATRHKMGTQACMMAKAVGYYTTGTCEFMMDKFKQFFFLEMNTRLQVEHPITEMITGVDLVEQMILIAAGHKLAYTQDDIKINGHSMEYRLYAEDPAKKFLPSIGFLTKYREPKTKTNVRIDTGVMEGSEISMYYDPMISKLIVWGKDRPDAIKLLNKTIDEFVVRGVNHNAGFCKTIINHKAFADGNYNTGFIPKYYKDGFVSEVMTPYDHKLIAIAAMKMKNQRYVDTLLEGSKLPLKNPYLNTVYVQIGETTYKVSQCPCSDHIKVETVEGKSEPTVLDSVKLNKYTLDYGQLIETELVNNKGEVEDKTLQFMEVVNQMTYKFFHRGSQVNVKVYDEKEFKLKKYIPIPPQVDMSKRVLAPMPGVVISVAVKPGDSVVDGQELLVLEAMKMQNVIKAEKDGKIKKVMCNTKQSVGVDDMLVELE